MLSVCVAALLFVFSTHILAGASTEKEGKDKAQDTGVIPSHYPVYGLGDLVRKDGNQERKMNARARWWKDNWGASLSWFVSGAHRDYGRSYYLDVRFTFYEAVVSPGCTIVRFAKNRQIPCCLHWSETLQ